MAKNASRSPALAYLTLPGAVEREDIQHIPLAELHEYHNHKFKVRMNKDMAALIDSVAEHGVVEPALVRLNPQGTGYELIAGHRRCKASELAGLETLPCIIRDIDDDTADILMADSNLQREETAPSEKAWAYRVKLEAMKRQGKRNDLTSSQFETKLRADSILAKEVGESRATVQRYIRLTYLIEPLLTMVDADYFKEDTYRLPVSVGVELSYLTDSEQKDIAKQIEVANHTPTMAQAQLLRKLVSENGSLETEDITSVLLNTYQAPPQNVSPAPVVIPLTPVSPPVLSCAREDDDVTPTSSSSLTISSNKESAYSVTMRENLQPIKKAVCQLALTITPYGRQMMTPAVYEDVWQRFERIATELQELNTYLQSHSIIQKPKET